MTLWQFGAWIKHAPIESPTNKVMGGDGLTVAEYLLFDWLNANLEKPHPGDPRVRRAQVAEQAELRAAHERAQARRAQLGITGSVLRRKKKPADSSAE